MPRYVIIGAGAIGVTFAAELQRSGQMVALVARGAQLEAARKRGITYAQPHGSRTLEVDVYERPEELSLTDRDVLVLATKTQDSAAALQLWAQQPVGRAEGATVPAGRCLPLLTTQNGLVTERAALRHFRRVIGGVLIVAAQYYEPGVVLAASAPAVGLAWIGAYPDRYAPELESLAGDLRGAHIDTEVVESISAWKNGKLLSSVTFVLEALYEKTSLRERAAALLREEALETLTAAGAPIADVAGVFASLSHRFQPAAVPGYGRGGLSIWQSLRRGSSLETPYINGEVVLQARLLRRGAPANQAITERIQRAADEGVEPQSLGDDDLLATLPQLDETAASASDVLVDPLSLSRELVRASPPAVLDVRWKLGDSDGALHYAQGHIPSAVYVDLDRELAAPPSPAEGRHPLPAIHDLERAARRWGIHEGQAVVVYDDNGGLSAARAWWLLRWAGVENVRILDGALDGWIKAGLELESGEAGAASGDVTLSAGQLAVLDAEAAARLTDDGVLLDARAPERYRGEHEPVDAKAGHIPRALSAPTHENLDVRGRFLPGEELRARFEALGLDDETEIGVYCGSGVTAAHLLVALRIAGLDATLFPGSWSAWSSDSDRPVTVGAAPR